jgi:hypothetical protein
MEPDPRLRDPSFNPNDDPACASTEFTWTREHAHCVITLFDRLCVAAISGISARGTPVYSDKDLAHDASAFALAMLEVRAKLFGVRID